MPDAFKKYHKSSVWIPNIFSCLWLVNLPRSGSARRQHFSKLQGASCSALHLHLLKSGFVVNCQVKAQLSPDFPAGYLPYSWEARDPGM